MMSKLFPLRGKHGRGKFAIVDDEDYEWLMQWKWRPTNEGYVLTAIKTETGKQRTASMHRELAKRWGWDIEGKQIDHIDHDPFNNCRDNLRIATNQQNTQHKSGPCGGNQSGFLGVHPFGITGKWRASIGVDGQERHIGLFDTPEEAAHARDSASAHFFGEFASLNFPHEKPAPYMPSPLNRNNTSGYRGVSWNDGYGGWHAQIGHQWKSIHIGTFSTAESAARAYDNAARNYHAERARLNFPDE